VNRFQPSRMKERAEKSRGGQLLTMQEKLRAEVQLLRQLESAVRLMFEFTGWEDGVDPEARMAIDRVSLRLNELETTCNALELRPHLSEQV
jgi:hypothetical protein